MVKELSSWLIENGYKPRDRFVNDASVEGISEEDRDAQWQDILDEFYNWCDEHGFVVEEDC